MEPWREDLRLSVTRQDVPHRLDDLHWIVARHLRGPARADARGPVEQQRRRDGREETRLHLRALVHEVLQDRIVLRPEDLPRDVLQLCADVPELCVLAAVVQPGAELATRHEEVHVVGANVRLRKPHDSLHHGLLTVVILGLLHHDVRKHGDLHLRLQAPQGYPDGLPLRRFHPVHEVGDGALAIVHRKVDEALVKELLVRGLTPGVVQVGRSVVGLQKPVLPPVRLALVKSELEGLVVLTAGPLKGHRVPG
mmetsp:Transcript_94321/g.304583  ORF Transcript_94321/g.304583 Transcript_94321/m.304583 type:complete len:252 (-) Transcript_94321:1892-2647(-)